MVTTQDQGGTYGYADQTDERGAPRAHEGGAGHHVNGNLDEGNFGQFEDFQHEGGVNDGRVHYEHDPTLSHDGVFHDDGGHSGHEDGHANHGGGQIGYDDGFSLHASEQLPLSEGGGTPHQAEAPGKKKATGLFGMHPALLATGGLFAVVACGYGFYMKQMASVPVVHQRPAPQAVAVPQPQPQRVMQQQQPAPAQAQPRPVAMEQQSEPAQEVMMRQQATALTAPVQATTELHQVSQIEADRFTRIEQDQLASAARVAAMAQQVLQVNGEIAALDGRVTVLETKLASSAKAEINAATSAVSTAKAPHVERIGHKDSRPDRKIAAATGARSHSSGTAAENGRISSAETVGNRAPQLTLDAVAGSTAWLSTSNGASSAYAINSEVPGWGKVIQIRHDVADPTMWQVVTERGIAAQGRE